MHDYVYDNHVKIMHRFNDSWISGEPESDAQRSGENNRELQKAKSSKQVKGEKSQELLKQRIKL